MKTATKHHLLLFLLCVIAALLYGCAHLPQTTKSRHIGKSGAVGECAEFFASLDRAARESKSRDAGAFRIKGYPYLRVDRFLASFTEDDLEDDATSLAWLDELQILDQEGRYFEIKNLRSEHRALLQQHFGGLDLNRQVKQCGDLLRAADFVRANDRDDLKSMAKAPDEYVTPMRAVGLYPLPMLFVSEGVRRWHDNVKQNFTNSLPHGGSFRRYAPPADPHKGPHGERTLHFPSSPPVNGNSAALLASLKGAKTNALGVPIYSPATEKALFNWYAPIWEVETRGEYDLIGAPEWANDRSLRSNPDIPVTFRRVSYTRFNGRVLPQLNYVIWFPERPREGLIDLVGGFMDGVNYRVTLDLDGRPLLYETVHNCGCYHQYYTTRRINQRAPPPCTEPPLVLTSPVFDPRKERLVISMESGAHQVRHLYTVARETEGDGRSYVLQDYDQLRSLPMPGGGSRSMFGEDGIVPGTQRLERFIFWPTGVPSAGAMRQWGRHAVAFFGKRHFDDPYLIESLFERQQAPPWRDQN
jgi:hypothetical protein